MPRRSRANFECYNVDASAAAAAAAQQQKRCKTAEDADNADAFSQKARLINAQADLYDALLRKHKGDEYLAKKEYREIANANNRQNQLANPHRERARAAAGRTAHGHGHGRGRGAQSRQGNWSSSSSSARSPQRARPRAPSRQRARPRAASRRRARPYVEGQCRPFQDEKCADASVCDLGHTHTPCFWGDTCSIPLCPFYHGSTVWPGHPATAARRSRRS